MKRSLIVEIISFIFIALFLYTGVSKWMDYYLTKEQIALLPLFKPIARALAFLLPAVEIAVAVLLFIPASRKIGFYMSLGLMLFFIGYVIYILNYDKQQPCTCGGVIELLSWRQHLLLNGVLALMALIAILLTKRSKSTSLYV